MLLPGADVGVACQPAAGRDALVCRLAPELLFGAMLDARPWGALFFDLENTLVAKGRWRPGALRCLGGLAGAGLRLGLIVNTGTMARDQLGNALPADFAFERFFEERLVVLSSEVGVEKPDARIFAVALSRAGLAPERTLFVADDAIELLAAQRIGMQGLRLGRLPRDFEVLSETALGRSAAASDS